MKEDSRKRSYLRKDEQLIVESQNGQKEAFGELVLRYQNYVMGYLVNRIKDRQAAEDLTQETFLRAYRSLGTCRDRDKFGSWLVGIAHNCTLEWQREKNVAANIDAHVEAAAEKIDEFELEKKVILQCAIRELPDTQRKILEMKYHKNMSCTEIATSLGKPIGTITGLLSRAYDALWNKLAKYWEESK